MPEPIARKFQDVCKSVIATLPDDHEGREDLDWLLKHASFQPPELDYQVWGQLNAQCDALLEGELPPTTPWKISMIEALIGGPLPVSNCTTCQHRISTDNACGRLSGSPPPGPDGAPVVKMADEIFQWRSAAGLLKDGCGHVEPVPKLVGCPGYGLEEEATGSADG